MVMGMAEYIKRDAALRALCQVSAPTPSESYIVEKCIEKVNRLPMIEVVRCKDCRHCTHDENIIGAYGYCYHFGCYAHDPMVEADDFCSYGERREGE
jgi:hypothetical protein